MAAKGAVKHALALCVALWSAGALAEGLPPPSRTVYKCEEGGKVNYSDSPCLGAKKVDVEPTRGLNKSTGRELRGQDVDREHWREGVAEMVRPVTGMDSKQFDRAGRRQRLSADAQRQCRALDQQLPAAEATEAGARAESERAASQKRLFELRAAYRKLRCD